MTVPTAKFQHVSRTLLCDDAALASYRRQRLDRCRLCDEYRRWWHVRSYATDLQDVGRVSVGAQFWGGNARRPVASEALPMRDSSSSTSSFARAHGCHCEPMELNLSYSLNADLRANEKIQVKGLHYMAASLPRITTLTFSEG